MTVEDCISDPAIGSGRGQGRCNLRNKAKLDRKLRKNVPRALLCVDGQVSPAMTTKGCMVYEASWNI